MPYLYGFSKFSWYNRFYNLKKITWSVISVQVELKKNYKTVENLKLIKFSFNLKTTPEI